MKPKTVSRRPLGVMTLGCGGGNCVLGSDDPPQAARRTLQHSMLSLLPFNSLVFFQNTTQPLMKEMVVNSWLRGRELNPLPADYEPAVQPLHFPAA